MIGILSESEAMNKCNSTYMIKMGELLKSS